MRHIFPLYIFLLSFSCNSQHKEVIPESAKDNLKIQVDQMVHALISKDYNTLLKFTYPKLIENKGGPDKAMAEIIEAVESLKKQDIALDSISIGQPTEFVKAGNEIHTIIPETLFIQVPRGILKSEGYLIGITQNLGKTWHFIDGADVNTSNITTILPNYNPKLRLPEQNDPILIKEY